MIEPTSYATMTREELIRELENKQRVIDWHNMMPEETAPEIPGEMNNVLAAPSQEHRLSKPEDGALRTPEDTPFNACMYREKGGDYRRLLIEAHRFLNAQAYTQEEMEDYCKRLDTFLGPLP